MPHPSPEPDGLSALSERLEPSVPEVRTEGFDGGRRHRGPGPRRRGGRARAHQRPPDARQQRRPSGRPGRRGSAIVRWLEPASIAACVSRVSSRRSPGTIRPASSGSRRIRRSPPGCRVRGRLGRERVIELRLGTARPFSSTRAAPDRAHPHPWQRPRRHAARVGHRPRSGARRARRGAGLPHRDHGPRRGHGRRHARQAVEPFFTTRAPGHGLGLGLTIARMVAESHGGYLEVESRLGLGTTVSLRCRSPTAMR